MMQSRLFTAMFRGVPEALRHNFLYMYLDIASWGFYTGSTIVFLTVYAARAGATTQQIGLMSAAPALISLVLSIPAGLFARRYVPKKLVTVAAFFARMLLFAYVLIPMLPGEALRINALLVVTALIAVPNTLLNIVFGPFLMSVIPSDWRGTVVSLRNAIMSVLSFVVTLVCGQILTAMAFPAGYQIVFFIGFLGAMGTVYALSRTEVLNPDGAPTLARTSPGLFLPRIDPSARRYIVIALLLFALNATTFMANPVLPELYVNEIRLSDAVISVGAALTSMIVFVVSLFVARLTRRAGNRRGTVIGVAVLAAQTLLLAFARDAATFLAASAVAGLASGILAAAQYNYHLDNLPREEQTVWIAWSTLLGNIAALLGSLAGPAIAEMAGIPVVLGGLALLRLLIGLAIWLWG